MSIVEGCYRDFDNGPSSSSQHWFLLDIHSACLKAPWIGGG